MQTNALIALTLLLLAIAIVIFYVSPKMNAENGEVSCGGAMLSLETDSNSYIAGSGIVVFGHDACAGNVVVYSNGEKVCSAEVSESDSSYSCSFEAKNPGSVELRVESGACSETKIIYVKAPECNSGDSRGCPLENSCPGISVCANGAWGGCSATGIVCEPGSKVGCGMPNACGFGYKECNGCGTGYGECGAATG